MNRVTEWEEGASLEVAYLQFNDPAAVRAYSALRAKCAETPFFMVGVKAILEPVEGNKAALAQAQAEHSEMTRQERALKESLLARLRNDHLRGAGFVLPREPTHQPAYIPPDVWGGNVDWGGNTVSGNGLKFAAVRIFRPQTLLSASQEGQRPGRPSRRQQIDAALDALDAEGLLDRTRSIASHFSLVRKRVWTLFPDEPKTQKGLGDKVLYEVLSGRFSQNV